MLCCLLCAIYIHDLLGDVFTIAAICVGVWWQLLSRFSANSFDNGVVTIYECVRIVSTSAFCDTGNSAAWLVDSAAVRLGWSLSEQRMVENAPAVAR